MIVLHKKAERERIQLVQFSPDGRSLLTSSGNGRFLWSDLVGARARRELALGALEYARFSPDGRFLLTDNNALTVTDLSDGQSRQIELCGGWSSTFDLTTDGRRLVIAQNNSLCGGWSSTFDLTTDGRRLVIAQNNSASAGWVTCRALEDLSPQVAHWSQELPRPMSGNVACLPGDQFVLAERWWDPGLHRSVFRYVVRSTETGDVLTAAEGPEIASFPTAISSGGALMACLLNARVNVLSTADFSEPVATLRNDGRKHFTGVAFHPSGRYLAATSNDATVKLYDTATWQVARTFTWDIGRMRSIAFSPDGALAAAGSDTGKVVVWDVDL